MYGEMGWAVLPASMLTEILFPGALGVCAPSARTNMAPASSITASLLSIVSSLPEPDRNFPNRLLEPVDYISNRTRVRLPEAAWKSHECLAWRRSPHRSEERRVGKEWRSGWSPYH